MQITDDLARLWSCGFNVYKYPLIYFTSSTGGEASGLAHLHFLKKMK